MYRYEGKLNGIENAVVLLSYPEKAFGKPKALRAFLSTDVSLSTDEILSYYVCRWPIEVFFRQCKDKLALDSYQIRSVIIPGLSEPPVRTLRATIPGNESQLKFLILDD